ncbi:MAG: DUF2490 domain-containing protein [Chloroherpetonaceae bacterium]|nr:DUF2490 domain-containing protein [Chloroherpetonaceae bacterium]
MKSFSFSGGTNGYYTFNKDITNFFEVRPWLALQLKIPVIAEISFRQRLRYEYRFFYTEDPLSAREDYARLRYQLSFDFPISASEDFSLTIRSFFEWFFIRNPATFERFSNERDYGVTVIIGLNHEHELSLRLILEEFYRANSERQLGYTFLVAYSL